MNKVNQLTKEQKNEEKLLLAKVLDKVKFSQTRNRQENTDFMNLAEQMYIEKNIEMKKIDNCEMYGGYESAERKMLVIYPQYYIDSHNKKDERFYEDENSLIKESRIYNDIISIIRIALPKELYKTFEHKTYLGALMKLGLKREKIGDILVRDNGADIIVAKEVERFIISNLPSLTRFQKSKITSQPIEKLQYTEQEKQIIKINVPSMRLDCIVGELAKCSRSDAVNLINEERVFVNFKQEIVASKKIEENTYITIRGKGRFKINKIIATTRSGRLSVEVEK